MKKYNDDKIFNFWILVKTLKANLTNGGGLFESDKSAKVSSAKADNSDKLYEQIGRLQVENTFLKISCREYQCGRRTGWQGQSIRKIWVKFKTRKNLSVRLRKWMAIRTRNHKVYGVL